MTLLWIGYATMVASLVAVSVAVLERAAHLAQLPSRFLWLGGLVAGVAFPLLWFAGGDATADATALSPLTLPAVVVTAGARAEALAAPLHRGGGAEGDEDGFLSHGQRCGAAVGEEIHQLEHEHEADEPVLLADRLLQILQPVGEGRHTHGDDDVCCSSAEQLLWQV